MKKAFTALVFIIAACNTGNSYRKAEDAQDAGREFIRASLNGDYDRARFYMLPDSVNELLLNKWKKDYHQLNETAREQYKDADILPINIQSLNDSVTSYTYANSYKKDTTTIRIIRKNGDWLVDFKEILNDKR